MFESRSNWTLLFQSGCRLQRFFHELLGASKRYPFHPRHRPSDVFHATHSLSLTNHRRVCVFSDVRFFFPPLACIVYSTSRRCVSFFSACTGFALAVRRVLSSWRFSLWMQLWSFVVANGVFRGGFGDSIPLLPKFILVNGLQYSEIIIPSPPKIKFNTLHRSWRYLCTD